MIDQRWKKTRRYRVRNTIQEFFWVALSIQAQGRGRRRVDASRLRMEEDRLWGRRKGEVLKVALGSKNGRVNSRRIAESKLV